MPFFKPLSKEERDKYLPVTKGGGDIEKCLQNMKNEGLQYCDEDVRWRHVGLFENKIVLFDLAELKELKKDFVVQDHIKLHDRRGDPAPAIPEIDRGDDDADRNE
jgi:hypothetical protein